MTFTYIFLKSRWFFAVLAFLLLGSCVQKKGRKIERGFYYWKTNVNILPFEDSVMQTLHSHFLYLRFFDVDVAPGGKGVKPKAIINFGKHLPNQEIIPVVFITTRALNLMNRRALDFYAENISRLLARKAAEIHLNPSEIQIDCDWTVSNKELYFALLKKLKKQPFFKEKLLSATIRLYQSKYTVAAGIPPVDKGLLMVYNMDDLTDFKVENSIITSKTAKNYLDNIASYPLPLDIALPIFSWTLFFDQHAQLKGILREVNGKDLKNESLFEKVSEHRYQVRNDTFYKGYALKKGNILRRESSNFKTIHKVAKYISDKISADSFRLLLYYCDSINFTHYSKYELEKIYSDFD